MSFLDQKHHIVIVYVCGWGAGEQGGGGEGERVEG